MLGLVKAWLLVEAHNTASQSQAEWNSAGSTKASAFVGWHVMGFALMCSSP